MPIAARWHISIRTGIDTNNQGFSRSPKAPTHSKALRMERARQLLPQSGKDELLI